MKFLMLLMPLWLIPVKCSRASVDNVCERMKYKDCSLVKAIIQYESSGDPLAIGRDGAGSLGLMQVKCSTARTLDREHGRKPIKCKDLFKPDINVKYGIEYLQYIEDLITEPLSMHELLSVYNGGYQWRLIGKRNIYRVKRCNAISIKKKRNCKKGEPFNIEYSRKVIQIYKAITKE